SRQLKIFIYARILVSFLFLVSTVALILKEPETINDLSSSGVVRLMVFSFLFSFVSYLFSKVQRFQFFIAYLQTIWDLLFITVLLLFTGGVTSPYSFLYLLSIMNAGVLLGRRDAFYTASQMEKDLAALEALGTLPEVVRFEGGHEWGPGFLEVAGRFLERVRG
ncbi:MAG: hypothetical protein HGA66_10765, partial [Holophaga sp.]|nr:hypothetical protein [Holophaga sp.]